MTEPAGEGEPESAGRRLMQRDAGIRRGSGRSITRTIIVRSPTPSGWCWRSTSGHSHRTGPHSGDESTATRYRMSSDHPSGGPGNLLVHCRSPGASTQPGKAIASAAATCTLSRFFFTNVNQVCNREHSVKAHHVHPARGDSCHQTCHFCSDALACSSCRATASITVTVGLACEGRGGVTTMRPWRWWGETSRSRLSK